LIDMSDEPRAVPPSPEEESAHERATRATTRFCFTYKFDGVEWMGDLYATTREEAEMKLKAMGRGRIDGRLVEIIPAD